MQLTLSFIISDLHVFVPMIIFSHSSCNYPGIFKFHVEFSTKNGTGTGETAIGMMAVDGLSIGE